MTKQELLKLIDTLPEEDCGNGFQRIAAEIAHLRLLSEFQSQVDRTGRGESVLRREIVAMIDGIRQDWLPEVKSQLERVILRSTCMDAYLDAAPYDDEELSAETLEGLRIALEEAKRGAVVTREEILREFGLDSHEIAPYDDEEFSDEELASFAEAHQEYLRGETFTQEEMEQRYKVESAPAGGAELRGNS